MNIITLSAPLVIVALPQSIQQPLLDCLDTLPNHTINYADKVTKTDWKTDNPRPYWQLLHPHIIPVLDTFTQKVDIQDYTLSEPWFQQYHKTDTHGWHRHPQSVYNVVYYLELPHDSHPTVLRNPLNIQQMITPNVQQGDLLIFPAFITHCSPPNPSSQRKSIIAFNIV
jgi:hypothetical protein